MDCDVVVVGAGISGLAAAFDLQRRGHAVRVFEAASRAGGVIGSQRRDGVLVETGPNSTLDTTPLIGELLAARDRGKRLGAAPRSPALCGSRRARRPCRRRQGIPRDAALLVWREARAGAEAVRRASAARPQETVRAFVRRQLGDRFRLRV
jgi:oxygen-dependent protoporphyrinogen oxidase